MPHWLMVVSIYMHFSTYSYTPLFIDQCKLEAVPGVPERCATKLEPSLRGGSYIDQLIILNLPSLFYNT